MISLKKVIEKLSAKSDLHVFTFDGTITSIASGSTGYVDVNVNKDGYKPIAVISVRAWDTGSSRVLPHGWWFPESNKARAMFTNESGSTQNNIKVIFHILYQRIS